MSGNFVKEKEMLIFVQGVEGRSGSGSTMCGKFSDWWKWPWCGKYYSLVSCISLHRHLIVEARFPQGRHRFACLTDATHQGLDLRTEHNFYVCIHINFQTTRISWGGWDVNFELNFNPPKYLRLLIFAMHGQKRRVHSAPRSNGLFTQYTEVLANVCKTWNTLLPIGVFTQHCKQHQRICKQICIQMCFRVLRGLGPNSLVLVPSERVVRGATTLHVETDKCCFLWELCQSTCEKTTKRKDDLIR